MKNCTNCGAANTDDAFACGNCGTPLQDGAPKPPGEGANVDSMGRLAPIGAGEEKGSFDIGAIMPRIIQAVIALVVIAGAFWFYQYTNGSPEKVVNTFLAASKKQDMKAAGACFSSQSRALMSDEELCTVTGFMMMMGLMGKDDAEAKVKDFQVTGDVGKAQLEFASPNDSGSKSAENSKTTVSGGGTQLWFRKEGGFLGRWKIDIRQFFIEQLKSSPQAAPMARAQIKAKFGSDPAKLQAWESLLKEAGY